MLTVTNVKNNTTQINIKINELAVLLAHEGIHMIKTNQPKDIFFNYKLRAIYINMDRLFERDNTASIDIAFDIIKAGYFC